MLFNDSPHMDLLKENGLNTVSALHCPLLDTSCPDEPYCATLISLADSTARLTGGSECIIYSFLSFSLPPLHITPVELLLILVLSTFSVSQR